MEFTVREILAWVLIIMGLFVVFWDIASSYYYFTAQQDFPSIFVNNSQASVINSTSVGAGGVQDQIGGAVKDQLKQLIPENTVTQLLNISSWTIFASFLLWAGGRLVGMGSDFLKRDK